MKVLSFSRGRGRGYAIPDVAIREELLDVEPSITLRFVSYGTGAETIGSGLLRNLTPQSDAGKWHDEAMPKRISTRPSDVNQAAFQMVQRSIGGRARTT